MSSPILFYFLLKMFLKIFTADCGIPENHISTQVSYTSTLEGYSAVYMCADGYQYLSGADQRICQSNGKWSGIIPTCRVIGKSIVLCSFYFSH